MPTPTDTPVNQVMDMRTQGMSNNQISQTLQRQGYSSTQVFDAFNQADMKGGTEPSSPQNFGGPPPNQGTLNLGMTEQPQQDSIPQQEMQTQPQVSEQDYYQQQLSSVGTEELVESIIDEKWEELMKDINKVVEWKNRTETRVTQMEQKMEDLKTSFDSLHKAIIGKVGEYDKHILDVGTEIKALEKVFQKVLPTFADNVKELSIISDKFKKGMVKKK